MPNGNYKSYISSLELAQGFICGDLAVAQLARMFAANLRPESQESCLAAGKIKHRRARPCLDLIPNIP